jgi:hypothetical protein
MTSVDIFYLRCFPTKIVIERWWELVMSAYFLLSLQAQAINESDSESHNEKI